ncbi:hypothetical protein A7985_07400 [Pseudoalteromonas luteoviolacea]|uniref:Uncharacterized protein n=1 Tax=Pseudoalteromonas luteoviolacea TaxID=43657 RepID=A0A1C0TWT7_9GAMM|nr:hypothetical protein [Pseudoalteromonas luteoviolacea]OCQ23757.1 hypothetical protein A7985_07400 [Pseudoalteromonas luteoviolacea]
MNIELLNTSIDSFINFLNQNFDLVSRAYEFHKLETEKSGELLVPFADFFDDWAQANWELLVERTVCSSQESLTIYGSGSDYEAAEYSRVFFHKAAATHEVICTAENALDWITGEVVELSKFEFDSFVSVSGDWFEVAPPFDHILMSEKGVTGSGYQQIVIPRNHVEFTLQPIEI